jgi:pimeloyl-ACP methyl ester carboxylesterase
MPHLVINGAKIYYEIEGNGPETIVFSHGLLWSGEMFREQVKFLRARYTCVCYDHRGQGRSEAAPTGYDMEQLYADALGLVQALKLAPCHFVGLSMGGFVGLRLAARHPDLVRSLMLLETSADVEKHKFKYHLLVWLVRLLGVRAVADRVMPIMFGHTFLADPARATLRQEWRQRLVANPPSIVRAVLGVIGRRGVLHELPRIGQPTLVVVGDEDVATPLDRAEQLRAGIPQAQLVVVRQAGHTSCIEEPTQVNLAIAGFLQNLS